MARQVGSDLEFILGAKISGLPAATASGQPVTFEQLASAVEGLAWKDDARVATQGNINLASPGATIDGVTMASSDRVLVRAQSTASQNGIYIWNGSAVAMTRSLDASTFDELEAAVIGVTEGTSAGASYRQSAINGTIGSSDVTWAAFGTSSPSASESTAGIAELATQAETDTGSDDARIVTPAKLAGWSGRKRKATQNIGDGSATQFDITHNFGTRAVTVEVYRNSGAYDTVLCDVSRPDTNTVRLNFNAAPTLNQFSAVVLG
jgi:hypothetical protein